MGVEGLLCTGVVVVVFCRVGGGVLGVRSFSGESGCEKSGLELIPLTFILSSSNTVRLSGPVASCGF